MDRRREVTTEDLSSLLEKGDMGESAEEQGGTALVSPIAAANTAYTFAPRSPQPMQRTLGGEEWAPWGRSLQPMQRTPYLLHSLLMR